MRYNIPSKSEVTMMNRVAAGALLWCAAVSAQSVRVSGGAVDKQVFQRSPSGVAKIEITGTASGSAAKFVEARITRNFAPVPGFFWKPVGTIAKGKFVAILDEVPTGGPYTIELRLPGAHPAAAAIEDVLVGDLWVLAGQSNMEGVGDLIDVELPDGLVHNFDLLDHWLVAEEPLHNLPGAVDRVHWRKNAEGKLERLEGEALMQFNSARKKGAGLGLPFATEMVKRTGVPIGLLSCAHGGTSMDQWDPALRDKGGDSLYGSMYRRFLAAGAQVAGVLWYQGESDANPKAAPLFADKFTNFVARVRRDFKQPNLPFYYVQIGRHVDANNQREWNVVQEAQRKLETAIPRVGMAAAVDFSLDDGIHVNTQDHKRLGRRMANLATGKKPGPRPVSAKLEGNVVRVSFSGINGTMRAAGRIAGFSIHQPNGAYVPAIFKSRFDPANPNAILLSIGGKLPEGAVLYYGFGKDPYCNVVDSEDMALPVFGPMPIE